MCPQSQGLAALPAKMTMPVFQRVIDEVGESRPLVKLYMSGEPLLHEGLFAMIEYAAARGCRTMVHTNATVLTEEMSLRILSSALTFLTFSFDGCTPQVYERLRRPAIYEHVKSNIRQYLGLRRSNGLRGPQTTIEIIAMRDTENYLQAFIDEWSLSGVDKVNVTEYLTWLDAVEDRRVESRWGHTEYRPCAAPFRHGCILSDGTVVPCCMDVNRRMPLGNIILSPFKTIWAGKNYRRLRMQMLAESIPTDSICHGCRNTVHEWT
jgi:MoaA/NifB/PqqE/SkfB family radical SAM enzyme